MIDDPLAALIAPISAETFFADYYEQKALHAKRDEPDRYAGLLSVDRIDEILAGVDLSADSLEMVRAEPRMQIGDFTHQRRNRRPGRGRSPLSAGCDDHPSASPPD